ncbi:helix-turn-helix domain-containing protein [Clostridium sp.]|uniref:helix-turn-helix domain-containing protein n=1 Tax=Clostridium sp. TaxID=1506 RepID=UPI003D6D2082
MSQKKLLVSRFINNPNRGIISYIKDHNQLKIAHSHDYYELFLVNKGRAIHSVNGYTQPLSPAMIVFVRPNDYHYYDNMTSDFQITNVIIPVEIINELFAYLSSGFVPERLLSIPFSPSIQISQINFNNLMTEFEELVVFKNLMNDKVNSQLRIVIMNIITHYFPIEFTKNKTSMPNWLRWLSLEMLKKDNFTEGLPAMYRLSCKTNEHMTRVCHKYLNKTPTQFINEIRVVHSAQLLISTNRKVIDICYDVGFENLSNYYHLFNKLYGMSPIQLRKNKDTLEVKEKIYNNLIVDTRIIQGIPISNEE